MSEEVAFWLQQSAEEQRFWLNFWLQLFVAVATFAAVLAALFGKWVQGRLMPPRLHLWVNDTEGDRRMSQHGDHEVAETIWHHIRVRNDRRAYSPATHAEVRLLKLEVLDNEGALSLRWKGEALMPWRSEERLRKSDLTIGAPHDCDLFALSKRGFVQIATKTTEPFQFPGECHIVMTLRAFSLEGDSEAVRVQIDWDGVWPDDRADLEKHLRVRMLSAASTPPTIIRTPSGE